jgi:hypothetical protein
MFSFEDLYFLMQIGHTIEIEWFTGEYNILFIGGAQILQLSGYNILVAS